MTTRCIRLAGVVVLVSAAFLLSTGRAAASAPSFGPNVVVLDPSMPQASIQAQLDAISTQQVSNQFGTQRYAVLFEPGTYGSAADPLVFQLGYYTQVAGLGATPNAVVVNGAIDVFNQCAGSGPCDGLNNFWRSLSNLTLNVKLPAKPPAYAPDNGEDAGCKNSNDLFAVSQASPVRSVIVNGALILQDYCNRGFVSGGFFANDELNGFVGNFGQQQWLTRNSTIGQWSNAVWNQVFLGDVGAPDTNFGAGGQYTNVASARVSEEPPFLTVDASGAYSVFVPAVRTNSVGPNYAGGTEDGTSIPIGRFFVASPSTSITAINLALALGKNLILTPGVYSLPRPILVPYPNTVVLGLGLATLVPTNGNAAIETSSVPGIKISGLIIDAGPINSRTLLQLGSPVPTIGRGSNPTLLSDVFFRIGGATPGRATTSLVVNVDDAILDDVWAWRADHGAGVGWTANAADTGVVVNGDNVSAYGLFVEHFQKAEVIWNGQNGEDVFFQNEMPYDPPSQAAWMSTPTTDGYPAFLVSPNVKSFQGYGMGSYSFFNQGVPIFATQAFQAPTTPDVQFHGLLTVFLDATNGSGGILSVINGTGGSSTAANADFPVDVVTYP
ncbi:MAG TPA: coagulation factor 5/8 type domain-containing protein [Gaiellaceae bacterium]|nr:coagulation factor 5/8 type domain-containing protein [Gaiellaceae bacterium]